MISVHTPTLADVQHIVAQAREDEKEQYAILVGQPWDEEFIINEVMAKDGAKWAICYNGEVLVVCGYDHLVNGVYQSWMIGTMDTWERHWRSITKASRKIMDAMLAAGARRLQTCVLASRTKTCEWYVKGLKMQFEGEMRGFGANGETMAMYARVNPNGVELTGQGGSQDVL